MTKIVPKDTPTKPPAESEAATPQTESAWGGALFPNTKVASPPARDNRPGYPHIDDPTGKRRSPYPIEVQRQVGMSRQPVRGFTDAPKKD
jgi:hypothetical protein